MRRIWFLAFFAMFVHAFGTHPEEKIIVQENFLTPEQTEFLIHFYDSEKKGSQNGHTDNPIPLQSISDPAVRMFIYQISNRIIELIAYHYQPTQMQQLDFCGLFSRITGNYAVYHADNIRFECPIHGADQSKLRKICDGTCPGSRFVPNHTHWRTYTGLVYLNDDFEGGEILFEDGPAHHTYQKIISIKAGMLVLSPNGSDFYHEVFPIRKGIRRSIHFWFTDDPLHFYRY